MATRHVNAELLLGTRVRDSAGASVGRVEEFRCGKHGGYDAVLEYHLGTGAALERFLAFVRGLPFFGGLPARQFYRVPWQQMDLSDPARPRLRVPRSALEVSRLEDA